MNDTLKMYGSIGLEIMNRYFVVAMCFKRQPRWRRLQTINTNFPDWAVAKTQIVYSPFMSAVKLLLKTSIQIKCETAFSCYET